MKSREITENIALLGAVDWNRTLFDALIPAPRNQLQRLFGEGQEQDCASGCR